MTLTKAELADLLFEKVGFNKREAKDMVESFFEELAKPEAPVSPEPVKPTKRARKPRKAKVAKSEPVQSVDAYDVMPPLPKAVLLIPVIPPRAPADCEIIPPPFNPYKKMTATFFFSC